MATKKPKPKESERIANLERQMKELKEWKKEVERRLYNLEPIGAKEEWKDEL